VGSDRGAESLGDWGEGAVALASDGQECLFYWSWSVDGLVRFHTVLEQDKCWCRDCERLRGGFLTMNPLPYEHDAWLTQSCGWEGVLRMC